MNDVLRRGVQGRLHLAGPGGGDAATGVCTHRSTFVNGAGYEGMEDTDIRGFLDGVFNWGWNQAGQGKIRVGREEPRILPPRYGEDELFRILMRWDGIQLPEGATVTSACISLTVFRCPGTARQLFLYAMRRDWNPGAGGVDGNNVSVPRTGEAWWGAAAHEQESWGLPGAGYAADDPDADVSAMPLASVPYEPGMEKVTFESPPLARYAADRIVAGRPLLFLLKVSDLEEDEPGKLLAFYSGDHGWTGETGHRPRLELDWRLPPDWICRSRDIRLEYGRVLPLELEDVAGIVDCGAAPPRDLWFQPEEGTVSPTLELASRDGSGTSWHRLSDGPPLASAALEARDLHGAVLRAAERPHPLGKPFEAEMTETWVVTGPAEDQEVAWTFWSPGGTRHHREARYLGGYRWGVDFAPDETGPWRYRWRHELGTYAGESREGRFDVVALDHGAVRDALAANASQVATEDDRPGRTRSVRSRLMRLERAGLGLLSPEDFGGKRGGELRAEVRRLREVIWQHPLPDQVPMASHPLLDEVDGRPLRDPIPDFRPSNGNRSGRPLLRRMVSLTRKLVRASIRFIGKIERDRTAVASDSETKGIHG